MEQEVNIFNEGLHSDNHPALQPPNTYRDAANGNLIAKSGGNYSFESTEGSALNWTMPLHITNGTKFVPNGWYRMGESLVVYSTDNKSIGGDGEIGLVSFNNAGIGTYEAMYYHTDLFFTQKNIITGYGIEENDAYHRAYWTDNLNQPRTINLAAAILSTTYLTGDLVIGKQYMVLTNSIGHITHAAVDYGPKQAAGNVFTATGTAFTTTGSVKVIAYLNVNILNYTPQKAIGTIDFNKYIAGQLNCGVKMYAYRLSTFDGYQSSWSFLTNPIHVGPNSPGVGYQQYQGGGAGSLLTNSTKGIELRIEDIPPEFDKIQVGVIEIDQAYDVIRNMEIFWDSTISGPEMFIDHLGQENLGSLIIDDLSLKQAVIVKLKTMATLKSRQIISNLTTREELDINLSGISINPFAYELPADRQGVTNATYQFNTLICPAAGIASGNIFPGGHYVIRGTGTVTYNAIVYAVGDTFVGVAGVTTFAITTGVPIVRGCIRIKQYNKFAGGQVYKIIDLMDEYFDYKSMASHMYLKGYWREETYRFAVVFMDKFGNPFYARFLIDTQIPSQSDVSGTYKLLNNYSDTQFTLNALGVEINGIDITGIKDKISGLMIVRVPRDQTVLGQGMLWQMVQRYDASGTLTPNTYVPLSSYQPQYDNHAELNFAATGTGYTLPFHFGGMGPEFDFNSTQFNINVKAGDKLKAIADYSPLGSGGLYMQCIGTDQELYSKYYNHNRYTPHGGSGQPNVIEAMTTDVADSHATFGGLTFSNNDVWTWSLHPDQINSTTPGGLHDKVARGGHRVAFTVDEADYFNASNANHGTGTDTTGTFRKLLVNYYRPKDSSTLYGGTSDLAKANNLYIPTGHYLKIDSTVLSDINDGSGNYILNGIQVFGGDCFVQLHDRVNSVFDDYYDSHFKNDGSYSWGVIFPVESNLNVYLRQGRHFAKDGMHLEGNGVFYERSGISQEEAFNYNFAYSTENDKVKYLSLPNDFRSVSRFPYRSRYSQLKILGESIDNMRIFLIDNFKDADALGGQINNVAVGYDRLFYWQDKGIGYYPIEEREMQGGVVGQAVQLGIGGVMQRRDTLDMFYGNQHQFGLITTENGFQWFDMRRRAFLNMTYDGQVVNVSVIRGLESFFQNVFVISEIETSNIFNLDTPLLGFGIIGVYDPLKKTTYMTFNFSSNEARPVEDYERLRSFTIGISSQIAKFVCPSYGFTPGNCVEHNGRVYMVKTITFPIISAMEYVIGMEVSKGGSNYVCFNNFITSDPIGASQQPDFGGSLYWKKTGDENEVHMLYAGDMCKFFGIVYPFSQTVVVKPAIDGQKTFDCGESYGNEVALTDVFCVTDQLNSSDQSISLTNKNYRFFDGKWNFNFPLSGKQRLTGEYLIVKLQVRNFLTDITTSTNLKKLFVFFKTSFRFRK